MQIAELLPWLPRADLLGSENAEITSVAYDSRRVRPGALFVAVPGLATDGHDYLQQAIDAGAAAIAVQAGRESIWRPVVESSSRPALVLEDTRAGLAAIAAAINRHPTRQLGVIGVTGTDGKTSLCHLIDHILAQTSHRPGLVTTAECRIGERALLDTGRFTSPEAPELQQMLREMVEAGCNWAVLEATSHGLAQHRLDFCDFDIAAVTTIGSDHLEFHGTWEAYVRAKGRLFEMLGEGEEKGIPKTAVLNIDDPVHERFKRLSRARTLSYGSNPEADVRAGDPRDERWSTAFTLITSAGSAQTEVHGPGLFGVQNALAAAAVGLAAGLDVAEIGDAIRTWRGAPGRMQLIDERQLFDVVVDFAHAPDSLARVLDVLRRRSRGRLIALFGCIGERERDRRFAMGKVAGDGADFTIVTDDNPYTEDRDAIIAEIVSGLESSGKRAGHDFVVIPDRRLGIAHALAMAVDEDVVLLAGKGHETIVHLPGGAYECDDREVAQAVIADLTRHSTAP